jgi:hypothetical protein
MKRILLLALLSAFPFATSTFADVPKKKDAAAPEKKIEPKKKYAFIGKLWEKEKIEADAKEEDKKAGDKKGKKDKKGKRSHLLKFEIKEVMDGEDALKPGLFVLCVTEPGPLRNPNQVKGFQAELGGVYRITSSAKLVKEKEIIRLTNCRLFSAKGKVGEEYKVGRAWKGSLPVKALELFPEEQRQSPIAYLGDNKSFTDFWKSFKAFGEKGAVPNVDFSRNVIVVMKSVRHAEPIVEIKARLDKDALRVTAKKNFEFEGRRVKGQFYASFFILPRKGISTIASGKKHVFELKPPGFIYAD